MQRSNSALKTQWIPTMTGLAVFTVAIGGVVLARTASFAQGQPVKSVQPVQPVQRIMANPQVTPQTLRIQKEHNNLVQQANRAIREHRYKESEVPARRLVTENGKDLLGWYFLARSLDGQGREKEACSAYAELLRENTQGFNNLQQEPDVLMRYAVLCFHTNQWQNGEYAARKAMSILTANDQIAKKLPPLPEKILRSDVRKVEAISHLLSGKALIRREGEKAGIAELDAAIQSTTDDDILAAAYWLKFDAYGVLQGTDPANRAQHEAEWKKAGQLVKFYDRSLSTYKKPLTPVLTPAEFKAKREAASKERQKREAAFMEKQGQGSANVFGSKTVAN